jgi:hypothetical protein
VSQLKDEGSERIGQFLLKIGAMTETQLAAVLAAQETEPNKLFGEIAIEKGFVDDSAIQRYLDTRS